MKLQCHAGTHYFSYTLYHNPSHLLSACITLVTEVIPCRLSASSCGGPSYFIGAYLHSANLAESEEAGKDKDKDKDLFIGLQEFVAG